MFIAAQIAGLIGSGINIFSIQLKEKKNLLFCFALVNLMFAINFFLLSEYAGTVICLIAFAQTIVSYIFHINNKEFPRVLIPVFIVISLLCGAISYKSYIDILPVICSVLYIISILQKREKYIRITVLLNILLWIIYDAYVMAYTAMISDVFFTISTLIAIARYDFSIHSRGDKI
jgi:uncharacterized membrane protein YqjE